MGELILVLLHSATNAHIHHWKTSSFSQHEALGDFYEKMPDLVDALVEACIGVTGKKPDFPNLYVQPTEDPVEEMESLKDYFDENRGELPDKSEIQNLADAIGDLIDSTIYKLKFLQ
jgi:hypothetical protein